MPDLAQNPQFDPEASGSMALSDWTSCAPHSAGVVSCPVVKKKQNPPQDSRLKSAKDLNIQHSPTQSNSATPHTNKKTSSQTGPKKINPFLSHQYTLPSKSLNQKVPRFCWQKTTREQQNPHQVAPRTPHRILPAGELQSFLSLHLLRNLHLARSRRPAISSEPTPFVWKPIKMTPDFLLVLLGYYVGTMQKDPYKKSSDICHKHPHSIAVAPEASHSSSNRRWPTPQPRTQVG